MALAWQPPLRPLRALFEFTRKIFQMPDDLLTICIESRRLFLRWVINDGSRLLSLLTGTLGSRSLAKPRALAFNSPIGRGYSIVQRPVTIMDDLARGLPISASNAPALLNVYTTGLVSLSLSFCFLLYRVYVL